jgi:hypothetical protein
MEIKTKYNVGDKVWIMRNNKPEKIQISNIEVEVIGDVPVGTCSLSGEYYTKIIYVEVQRSEYIEVLVIKTQFVSIMNVIASILKKICYTVS